MPAMTGQQVRDYIVDSAFKRTDKDTELYAALTDVIHEMRLEFPYQEAETDGTITDTIASLGEYKIDVNTDFGLLVSTVIMVDGDVGVPLDKISKSEYDVKYPNPTNAFYRGYPREWCLFGAQVLIGPPPDSTAYTYKMSSTSDSVTTDILASTTAVPFSARYRTCLKHGVLAIMYGDMGEESEAKKHEGLYEMAKYKAKTRESENAGVLGTIQYQDF